MSPRHSTSWAGSCQRSSRLKSFCRNYGNVVLAGMTTFLVTCSTPGSTGNLNSRRSLTSISHDAIIRRILEEVQLSFSDASKDAFAAVVYLRVCDTDGNARISLVMSKTRVAPLKRLTIPRLELCGAHLLAQVHGCPGCAAEHVLDVPLSMSWMCR